MGFLHLIIAGIAGTVAMTSLLNIALYAFNQRISVLRLLGTIVSGNASSERIPKANGVLIVGGVVHYVVGILSALPYFYFWTNGFVPLTIPAAVLLGLVHGLLAVIVWGWVLSRNSKGPLIPRKLFLTSIGIAYLFFSLGVFAAFQYLNHTT